VALTILPKGDYQSQKLTKKLQSCSLDITNKLMKFIFPWPKVDYK